MATATSKIVVSLIILAGLGPGTPATAQNADARNIKGFELLKAGKPAEAIAEFKEVLKLDPSNKVAAMYLRVGQN